MPFFVKKPLTVEAWVLPQLFSTLRSKYPDVVAESGITFNDNEYQVHTLEGVMSAKPGDYLIKGIKGEFYFCRRNIFHDTYDPL